MVLIIGITGTIGAGKGTIVEHLKEKGFLHYSVREFLWKEVDKRGLPRNRDSLVDVANDLRKTYGPGYIMQELYKEAKRNGKDAIIESIRAVGEVKELRGKEGFILLAVDASPKLRYERITQRGTSTDNISYEEFIIQEKREMESEDPYKQNIARCMELSDHRITNEGSFEELYEKLEGIFDG